MLFSNRKLSAGTESSICKKIASECNIPNESICLCGLERFETWLKRFPSVPIEANLDPVDSPLIVSPDDLAKVIQALASQMNEVSKVLHDPPTPRVPYEQKNTLNNMSDDYAKTQRKKYLKETPQISSFLSVPENGELLLLYESIVDDFQLKIISKRKNYQSFDMVMEHLYDLLVDRDVDLRQNKKLTRAVLFYMYWNCDIGVVSDVETD
jgi:hypothetical protein